MQPGNGLPGGIPQKHAGVQRHLIVAAARGVQLLGNLAHILQQARLDVHVDVFQAVVELEIAGIQIALDATRPSTSWDASSSDKTPTLANIGNGPCCPRCRRGITAGQSESRL
jgi:hypothetical protein